MKKSLAVILTLGMMLCLGGASLPESGTSGELIGEVPVMGTALTSLDDATNDPRVEVTWDLYTDYSYSFGNYGGWSPGDLKYTGFDNAGWDGEDTGEVGTITIKNYIQEPLTTTISFGYDDNFIDEYEDYIGTMEFTFTSEDDEGSPGGATTTLNSDDPDGGTGEAPTGYFYVSVSGAPTKGILGGSEEIEIEKIGTITITLSSEGH